MVHKLRLAQVFNVNNLIGNFGDINYCLDQWMDVCGFNGLPQQGECCIHVKESEDIYDFGGDSDALSTDGETRNLIYNPENCELNCDSTYIALNFTHAFMTQSLGANNVTVLSFYSGNTMPNVYNYASQLTCNLVSLRTTLEHEMGHWLGYPPNHDEIPNSCIPPNGDLMLASSNANTPPQSLSKWDSCWFMLLYLL